MNADSHKFKHGEITRKIIGVFFDVFNELGHGFLESFYQKSLELALTDAGINVRRKIEVPVWFSQ
jgi:GxxExxY protein